MVTTFFTIQLKEINCIYIITSSIITTYILYNYLCGYVHGPKITKNLQVATLASSVFIPLFITLHTFVLTITLKRNGEDGNKNVKHN